MQGGGNAANTATAISRLGLSTGLITKIGGIQHTTSRQILAELEGDGISTSTVLHAADSAANSPQTFIVSDIETNSRTCIHVPMDEELTPSDIDRLWEQELSATEPVFIHFDSRHPTAAVHLANCSLQKGIPISLDIEKFRPGADELLGLCDIIFTNERFPGMFAQVKGSVGADTSDLVLNMLSILTQGRARCVVTTCGEQGAVLLKWGGAGSQRSVAITKSSDSPLIRPGMFEGISFCTTESSATSRCGRSYIVQRCPIWPFDDRKIVDSTGAGDSFIGGFISGILYGLMDDECLRLGTLVASEKLRGQGARSTLPDALRIESILSRVRNT